MQVQFTLQEVLAMTNAVLDGLGETEFGRKDAAAIRRWRNDHITTTADEMALLTAKINAEVQQTHNHSQKSGIQKPDWV